MECLLPYFCMVTVPHMMVGLERMLEYRGVGLARFHFIQWSPLKSHLDHIRRVYIYAYKLQTLRFATSLCGTANTELLAVGHTFLIISEEKMPIC